MDYGTKTGRNFLSNQFNGFSSGIDHENGPASIHTTTPLKLLKSLNPKLFSARFIHTAKTTGIIPMLFAKGHGVMIRVNVAKAGAVVVSLGNSPRVMSP